MNAIADIENKFDLLKSEWMKVHGYKSEFDPALFANVLSEWTHLCAAERKLHSDLFGLEVAGWMEQFDKLQNEQWDLEQKGLWISGPSDLLTIIGRPRHELFHSFFLAWLLDPGMPHGIGDRLLKKVLTSCFPDEGYEKVRFDGAVSECEVSESQSRADIVVKASDLHLVIEMKVDALEGDKQCHRLFSDHAEERGAKFIFLTPTGRRPTSAPEETLVEFMPLSFQQVRICLSALMSEIGGRETKPPGFAAAQTYLQTLEKEFP